MITLQCIIDNEDVEQQDIDKSDKRVLDIKETDAPGEIEKQLEDKCFDKEPSSLYGRVD
ncbi:hypothetical protein CE91St1_39300 [Parabacteroides goldsteinii]|nr:hypothetical protein CE91St1_39300 [Parabacteroides goldsteinii]GKG81807.1 hypothetical protein CE91St2_49990 [Parabacteroides goldsteinii]